MSESPYISFKIRQKSGRSWIITPDGSSPVFEKEQSDHTLLRAFAQACLWERELERGKYASIRDLADRNKIGESYVRRILGLNYLSPKIQALIIDDNFPKYVKLQDVIYDIPISWHEQEERWLK